MAENASMIGGIKEGKRGNRSYAVTQCRQHASIGKKDARLVGWRVSMGGGTREIRSPVFDEEQILSLGISRGSPVSQKKSKKRPKLSGGSKFKKGPKKTISPRTVECLMIKSGSPSLNKKQNARMGTGKRRSRYQDVGGKKKICTCRHEKQLTRCRLTRSFRFPRRGRKRRRAGLQTIPSPQNRSSSRA